jgi:transcriptional regulator with XRE-family HTH domain
MTTTLKERLELAMAECEPPLSQADLARCAGVKPPSVHSWLSGETKSLRANVLMATARALNVLPEWLATGRGPMRAGAPAGRHAGLPLRLDREALQTAIRLLEDVFAVDGLEFDAVKQADLIASTYEELAANPDANFTALTVKISRAAQKKA